MKSICFCPKSVSCFGLLTTAKGAAPLHMVQYAAVLSLFKPTNILNSGILTLLHDTIFFKVYCSHKFTEQLFLAWHNIQKNSLRIKFHKNNLSFVGAGCAISFMASRGGFRFAVGLIASWPNFHPRGWRDFFFFSVLQVSVLQLLCHETFLNSWRLLDCSGTHNFFQQASPLRSTSYWQLACFLLPSLSKQPIVH